MTTWNILAIISPVIGHIKSLNHPQIKTVKDAPDYDALEKREVQILDGAVYVYPDGSSTDSQRANGVDIRNTVGAGIAVCVKRNTVRGMPYYDRAGEVLSAIMMHMALFIPDNPKYPEQQFFIPKDGAQERDHTHAYIHDHYLLSTRYIYQTFLKGDNP